MTLPTTGNQINIAESSQGEVISLIGSSTREILYSAKYAQTWLLDSGTIFHLTRHKEWFSNYSIEMSGTVRLDNGHKCKIAGTGEVPIQLSNGNIITLHQVQHLPVLKRSLVSIDMLAEDGYRTTLNESAWMINRGNLRIGSRHKYNNLYPLMAIILERAMNTGKKTDPNLLHGQLSHV